MLVSLPWLLLFLQTVQLLARAKGQPRQTSRVEGRHHLHRPSHALNATQNAPNISSVGQALFQNEQKAYLAQYNYEHPHLKDVKLPFGESAPILRPPPPSLRSSHTGQQSNNGRRMQQIQRSVDITNGCSTELYFAIVYYTSSGRKDELWYYLNGHQTTTFEGLSGSTYHVFGLSGSNFYMGSSPECLDDATCNYRYIQVDFPDWDVEAISSSFVFQCQASFDVQFESVPRAGSNPPQTPPNTGQLNAVERAWLRQHNKRRRRVHGNGKYVPLHWVKSLQQSAQDYAEFLIAQPGCFIDHGLDGVTSGFGENLAMNWNQQKRARSPAEVLTAWVEEEEHLPLDAKGHFIQANWRATKYVGCGQASKLYFWEGKWEGECFIQACRYITPGNCNLYQNGGFDWRERMLSDSSPCSPRCPSEGCFAG